MKGICVLLSCLALVAGVILCAAQHPPLFEGALKEVDFMAPEFPPPAQVEPGSFDGGPPDIAQRNNAPPPPTSTSPGPMTPPAQMPGPAPGDSSPQPPEFKSNGINWINSRPLTMKKLRGQVVMLDLWEYTCINCIRTLPDTIKWYERYHQYGFEVIGVHGPEFNIAYSTANVRKAVKRLGIPYPVVTDDQFRIFSLYHASGWPTRILIDAQGVVRYSRVGEGGDSAFEQAIQNLLKRDHPGLVFPAADAVPAPKNAFAPGCGAETPEMYVGNWNGRGVVANPEGYHKGKTINYRLPAEVEDGRVGLAGRWKTGKNGMTYAGKKKSAGGELEMQYHAREMYAVLNVARSRPSRLYLTQDGKSLTPQNKGVDVHLDAQGRSYVEVRSSRMYYLVQNPSDGSHAVVLNPIRPGVTVNSFTFGNNCQTHFAHL